MPAGGLAALIGTAAINGEDRSGLLRSGETLELQEGLLVHFPASKHANNKGELDGKTVTPGIDQLLRSVACSAVAIFAGETLTTPTTPLHSV